MYYFILLFDNLFDVEFSVVYFRSITSINRDCTDFSLKRKIVLSTNFPRELIDMKLFYIMFIDPLLHSECALPLASLLKLLSVALMTMYRVSEYN